MFRKLNFSLLCASLAFFVIQSAAQERVISFVSDITVRSDGVLTVKENITVLCLHQKIKRGIFREFPTIYKDGLFTRVVLDFDLQNVLLDGNAVYYELKKVSNGVRVDIGDDRFISRGEHTFTIEYTTTRQIGFFEDHDELYFNINGTGWIFPFDEIRAFVYLPKEIPLESIKTTAYTGKLDARGTDYESKITDNTIEFWTTKKLDRFEGLTIVVGWQKGFITQLSFKEQARYFFRDNAIPLLFLWAIIGFLVLFAIAGYSFVVSRRINRSGTIVPLFYPPTDMLPSEMAFMNKLEFSQNSIAADVVQCAVNGFLTIEESKYLYSYILKRVYEKGTPAGKSAILFESLFHGENSVTISKTYNPYLYALSNLLEKQLNDQYSKYISHKFERFGKIAGFCFWATSMIACLLLGLINEVSEFIGITIVFLIFYSLPVALSRRIYTPEGRKLQDKIDGFKMFLVTTELERMKIIGTPPTKTPELYEHYLPYAMALGVEKQWSSQFSSLFEILEKKGTPYRPRWYIGTMPFRGNFGQFGAQLSSSFASSIASSSTPPGRSSGFGRGGGSGRGGGGGGGGGR